MEIKTQRHGGTKFTKEEKEDLSRRIIGSAIEVHKQIGPGLLESVYEECLKEELRLRKINVLPQVPIPLIYKGMDLECDYRLDLLVEDEIIVELKAVESLLPIFEVQLLTYLKLTKRTLGLVINFNQVLLKNGIRRVINGYN